MLQKLAEAAELMEDKSAYYKYTPANVSNSKVTITKSKET